MFIYSNDLHVFVTLILPNFTAILLMSLVKVYLCL
jgi:hypothetical protein